MPTNIPEDLKYSTDHEWIRIEDSIATIGITHYAQDQLGEIVFTELPQEGEEFSKGDAFGVVESVKSVSDVLSPLSGQIAEINDPLPDTPETLNEDPYGEGWMIKVQIIDEAEIDGLLSSQEYEDYIREQSE